MLLASRPAGPSFYSNSSLISTTLGRADSASLDLAAYAAPHLHSGQNGLPHTILQWTIAGVSPSNRGLPERLETNSIQP
jgi:hypothetical protein